MSGVQTYVYAIGEPESSIVKIGVTKDPRKRLGTLQTGNARRLELIWTVEGDSGLESRLHDHFSDCRMKGEWFDLPTTDVVTALTDAHAHVMYGAPIAVPSAQVEVLVEPDPMPEVEYYAGTSTRKFPTEWWRNPNKYARHLLELWAEYDRRAALGDSHQRCIPGRHGSSNGWCDC